MIKHKIVYSEYMEDAAETKRREFRHVEFSGSIEGCIEYLEIILSELKARNLSTIKMREQESLED